MHEAPHASLPPSPSLRCPTPRAVAPAVVAVSVPAACASLLVSFVHLLPAVCHAGCLAHRDGGRVRLAVYEAVPNHAMAALVPIRREVLLRVRRAPGQANKQSGKLI
eukprot:459428-Prorocentrum_minimum.AAC.1